MIVDVIEGLQAFNALKDNWDDVYQADPESQFFLSSLWMSDWLPRLDSPWFILAVKQSAHARRYVAFMPLRLRTKESQTRGFYNEINMAGNYAADYTGFICDQEFEGTAIPALARHFRKLNWTHINFDNVHASDRRQKLFLRELPSRLFERKEIARLDRVAPVDHCICPYANLPDSWEKYLEGLSANTRQKLRKLLRQIEGNPEFRVTIANAETIDRDVRILLDFWGAKWAARKGDKLKNLLASNYATLTRSFAKGALFLPILWRGDQPLIALASFVDHQKKSFLFYITGRLADDTMSSGLALHAYSIRHAIAEGIRVYDFLRGNEAYKYSFGVEEKRISSLRISTRTGRNIGDRIDKRSIPGVLKRATQLHQQGKLKEAARAYQEILKVAPTHDGVLYRFAQLAVTQKNHGEAIRLYKKLVGVRPDAFKAWVGLARSLTATGQLRPAETALRKAIGLQPRYAPAYVELGYILIRRNDPVAIAEFEAALAIDPSNENAASGLSSAIVAIRKSTPFPELKQSEVDPRLPRNAMGLVLH